MLQYLWRNNVRNNNLNNIYLLRWIFNTSITSLLLIYPLYRKQEKKYYITIFIAGIIYDLLYTNLLFYDAIIFTVLGFIIKKIHENLDISHIKISIYIIGLITLYELSFALFIIVFNLVPITIPKIIYKITHSILLNIIYGELTYTIIKIIPNKYKRISIN